MLRNLRSHTGPMPCTMNTRWSTLGSSPAIRSATRTQSFRLRRGAICGTRHTLKAALGPSSGAGNRNCTSYFKAIGEQIRSLHLPKPLEHKYCLPRLTDSFDIIQQFRYRRVISTIRHFIVVIVDAPLHHPGPGLTLLGRAPLIRHGRGLELNYNLLGQVAGTNGSCQNLVRCGHFSSVSNIVGWKVEQFINLLRPIMRRVTFGLCMTMVSPDGNSSLRCHWLVDTAFLYSA